MTKAYKEYSGLDLSAINKRILARWADNNTFAKSVENRKGCTPYVFYEGPPSANGLPGIHHVMARAIKDIFCRFKTMQAYQVHRKAGWDTHGLPVELGVEKELGITKEDIGTKISVEEYNAACKRNVMKYTAEWEQLTQLVGYWVDMDSPYITYDNKYIETLWYLLKELYNKNLLYKGYTIQPYSPAAGTGLSSHELNQPGCYKDVKDTTCVAQFKLIQNEQSQPFFQLHNSDVYILAWTTTPWTLPSNTALCVGEKIIYQQIHTFNLYTGKEIQIIIAKDRVAAYFTEQGATASMDSYSPADKVLPYRILKEWSGKELCGLQYEQLIQWVKPQGNAFKIISGEFVTTADGTGIVHIAPTFGADDAQVAKMHNIVGLYVIDADGNQSPLVDKQGRMMPIEHIDASFLQTNVNTELYKQFAGVYVKNEYDDAKSSQDATIDIEISIELKKENKAFRIEKQTHNYPHCWRTDKPILYYPLDSWFIQTPKVKDRLIELNNTINWKPSSTGSGRFGKWLENLQDWNLSRSRYWGTPLPIWVSDDKTETKCIGSIEELKQEIDKSVQYGYMEENPLKDFVPGDYSQNNYAQFDLHRPYVDRIFLVSDSGKKMTRELDLIDVWFDSGAMPYAQLHYPFENKDEFHAAFPADFIAEGVDQTRGWFFTLHAISTMLFDSVAFKNVVSNGLVLDKKGNKMSKRLGNAVDPFKEIEAKGSDSLRWYMVTNASPWDNLKYDSEGVDEITRKFFGTLYNTYSFFALYANLDSFTMQYAAVEHSKRPELDRWILSLLHSLIKEVTEHYESYEPTKAGRCIQEFVTDNLSNWFVRLSRKRFWKGEMNDDKISAYQTLYTALETVAQLMAPIAPFYADQLFIDLTQVSNTSTIDSVHLADFPLYNEAVIDKQLEKQMAIAQSVSSMVLGLRRKVAIKVRQPLQKIIIPTLSDEFTRDVKNVEAIIKAEINIKEIELLSDTTGVITKKVKPNFKTLGPKYGVIMKQIAAYLSELSASSIAAFEREGVHNFTIEGTAVEVLLSDVDIISEDIPGWQVANEGAITVALDTTITPELLNEGIAREFVNRIQNYRKELELEVTDKIHLQIQIHESINNAIQVHENYIKAETLCESIELVENVEQKTSKVVDIDNTIQTTMSISKVN